LQDNGRGPSFRRFLRSFLPWYQVIEGNLFTQSGVCAKGDISVRSILKAFFGAALLLTSAVAQNGPIRVGGNVQQANLLSSVKPVYPPQAKANRIQGMVKLEIGIDKEGHVSQITVTSGPSELIQSAVDAVQQWVYKPTLLNGEPVVVLTTVDVNYTLSQ
jgi:TonB family protein